MHLFTYLGVCKYGKTSICLKYRKWGGRSKKSLFEIGNICSLVI